MWAALLALERHNRTVSREAQITTIASPDSGPGTAASHPSARRNSWPPPYRHWRACQDLPISQRERDLE